MKKYINKIVSIMLFGAILFSGCTDKFEEINTNPDRPTIVPLENMLAFSLWFTSATFYDRWFLLDEPCSFAGYVAKMSYIDEARYQFRPGVQDTDWRGIYRVLVNLREIQQRANESEFESLELAAKVMEIHIMQIATDRWRDIPYTDAVKLSMDEEVLTPTYDTQENIYPALLNLAKQVGDDFAAGIGYDGIDSGDLLYDGDMDNWRKFCNSMRLRMAIRISEVSPAIAKQHVEELLSNPSKYPLIDDNDANAFFWWDAADNTRWEPIAGAYYTRKTEFCAPDLLVDHMLLRKDPRIGVYFTPTPSSQTPPTPSTPSIDWTDGTPVYRGYVIGASSNASPSRNYSVWGQRYGIDLGGFSPYFRASEVYFHIAEAAMLGYNTGGITAEEAYYEAIALSMDENGVSAAAAEAYMDGDGKFDNTKAKLWYEEWVALFKQGMEGWSLYRRTGTPTNHYIAPGRANRYTNHTVPPFRSPYPDTERNLNKENNKPFNDKIVDDFWGQQMWWDTRKDVH